MHTTTTRATTHVDTGTGQPTCRSCGAHRDGGPEQAEVDDRLWRSYLWGIEYGTAYGITAGYQEAIADMWGVHDHLARLGLSRLPSREEVVARRRAAYEARPALSAAEIRAKAEASWAEVSA